jgi:hypothetical protein
MHLLSHTCRRPVAASCSVADRSMLTCRLWRRHRSWRRAISASRPPRPGDNMLRRCDETISPVSEAPHISQAAMRELIDQDCADYGQVLAVLDPLSLAAAACVCRQWRAAADASPAWQSISTGVCAAMPWQAGRFRAGHKAGFIMLARGAPCRLAPSVLYSFIFVCGKCTGRGSHAP